MNTFVNTKIEAVDCKNHKTDICKNYTIPLSNVEDILKYFYTKCFQLIYIFLCSSPFHYAELGVRNIKLTSSM